MYIYYVYYGVRKDGHNDYYKNSYANNPPKLIEMRELRIKHPYVIKYLVKCTSKL